MTASQDTTQPTGLVGRIKGLLLRPGREWPVIAAERTTAKSLFRRYAMPLALIGPLATLSHEIVVEGDNVLQSVGYFFFSYGLSLLGAYVLGIVLDGMAPTFGSTKNRLASMKLAVYAMTPYWLIGGLSLISPKLALGLTMTLGLYSLYLLFTGLTPLKQTPAKKRLGYLITANLIAILLSLVVAGLVIAGFTAFAVVSEAAYNILDR